MLQNNGMKERTESFKEENQCVSMQIQRDVLIKINLEILELLVIISII